LHIVHIINEPTGGGAELLVRELNQRLRNAGFDSCALFLTNPRNVDLDSSEYCFDLRSVRSISAPWRIRRFLQRFSGERVIVHAHLTYPLYYLAFMPRPSNTTLLYTEHNTYNRRRSVSALRPIERYIYSRFDAVACISEGVRTSLLNWIGHAHFGKRVSTVLNGARLFSFIADRPFASTGLTVVSLGSLTTQKGFDTGLRAVSLAADMVGRYVVLGEGPERDSLERKAKHLGIADRLEFQGWQEHIEPWLHEADVMLIPSRWEGFGLVAIEALSTGLPVVASNVAGLNEVLRDCAAAFLVEPDDPAAMAEAIRSYAASKASHKRLLAGQARARAEVYGLEAMTAAYAQLYEQLNER